MGVGVTVRGHWCFMRGVGRRVFVADMRVIYHKNNWPWGQQTIIVIASGRAMCSVSVENDDYSVAYLHNIIVHPSIRRRGYGRELLTLAQRRARLMKCTKLVLWADPNDWPFEWYKRNGFVVCDKRDDGLVNMEKELQ